MFLKLFCLIVFATLAVANPSEILRNESKPFPSDFLFGVASAAYQIEGAWNADGKGPSIWDDFTHDHPEKIKDHTNGDVAANSYEYFLDDIEAIRNLGMKYYRFSISWPRVLPNGDISNINEKGIEYYNKIIDKLLEYKIEPMVTMYHWDLPSRLQKLGGFTSEAIVNYFEDYTNLLFDRFGDRVKYWITFNEPSVFCGGYAGEQDAPAMNLPGVGDYLCGHNVLKAHAQAYQLYQNTYRKRFRGLVGITLNSLFYYPEKSDDNDADALQRREELAIRALKFSLGWFADPIFSDHGDYPEVMIKEIGRNSEYEGRLSSRLPKFSREWRKKIRGSADFLGLNHYSSRLVKKMPDAPTKNPSYWHDRGLDDIVLPEWKRAESNWLFSVPEGLGDILRYIKKEYRNPKVFITENGWSDKGQIEDNDRIEYMRDYLKQVLDAVTEDDCNVRGYTAWMIVDEFEWRDGYTEKFGLYSVNMTSERRERSPKKSVEFMKKVTETYRIPELN